MSWMPLSSLRAICWTVRGWVASAAPLSVQACMPQSVLGLHWPGWAAIIPLAKRIHEYACYAADCDRLQF